MVLGVRGDWEPHHASQVSAMNVRQALLGEGDTGSRIPGFVSETERPWASLLFASLTFLLRLPEPLPLWAHGVRGANVLMGCTLSSGEGWNVPGGVSIDCYSNQINLVLKGIWLQGDGGDVEGGEILRVVVHSADCQDS